MEKFENLKKILSVRKTNEGGKEIMLLILLGVLPLGLCTLDPLLSPKSRPVEILWSMCLVGGQIYNPKSLRTL